MAERRSKGKSLNVDLINKNGKRKVWAHFLPIITLKYLTEWSRSVRFGSVKNDCYPRSYPYFDRAAGCQFLFSELACLLLTYNSFTEMHLLECGENFPENLCSWQGFIRIEFQNNYHLLLGKASQNIDKISENWNLSHDLAVLCTPHQSDRFTIQCTHKYLLWISVHFLYYVLVHMQRMLEVPARLLVWYA